MIAESLLRGPAESALRLLGEALKGSGIVHRQISQDLAVELHARRLQSMDELVVAHAVQLGGRADAHDPQRTELTLFLAASGVSELQPALHGLFRRPVQLRFCQVITTGAVQYLFAFGAAFGPAFYTRHVVLLLFSI